MQVWLIQDHTSSDLKNLKSKLSNDTRSAAMRLWFSEACLRLGTDTWTGGISAGLSSSLSSS